MPQTLSNGVAFNTADIRPCEMNTRYSLTRYLAGSGKLGEDKIL